MKHAQRDGCNTIQRLTLGGRPRNATACFAKHNMNLAQHELTQDVCVQRLRLMSKTGRLVAHQVTCVHAFADAAIHWWRLQ